MNNIKKGWVYAFITAFLWGTYSIYLKIASSHMENVNGLVVVLQAMVAGSFFLLMFAGSGKLSIETIKSRYTWSFGSLQILSSVFSFAALAYALSPTEQTLLTRFSIILVIVLSLILEKKIKQFSKVGFLLVLIGVATVSYSIQSEFRNIALFYIFLMCLAQALRSRVASSHKESNHATGDFKAELRVAGYILAITSSFYACLLFITMQLGFHEQMPSIIPSSKEFFAFYPLLLSMGVAGIMMAIMRYTELIAAKHIGGTNLLTVTAFTPLCAFILHHLAFWAKLIPVAPYVNMFEAIGGIFIISGAIFLTRYQVPGKKKAVLPPKAKKHLYILRDSIRSTAIFVNDDYKKVAELLGVNQRMINTIMTKDKDVSDKTYKTLLSNFNINVTAKDQLTGAFNRASLDLELTKLNEKEAGTLFFIDLNKFKPINDNFGHPTGDSILKGITERLQSKFNDGSYVARLGGDEFVVIVYGLKSEDKAHKVSKEIEELISEPFYIKEVKQELSVGCSIGMAMFPKDSTNPAEILKLADERMFEHKRANGESR